MPVEKKYVLPSGGTVRIGLDDIQLFDLTEPERQFLDEIGVAGRKFERRMVAEGTGTGNGTVIGPASGTEKV